MKYYEKGNKAKGNLQKKKTKENCEKTRKAQFHLLRQCLVSTERLEFNSVANGESIKKPTAEFGD